MVRRKQARLGLIVAVLTTVAWFLTPWIATEILKAQILSTPVPLSATLLERSYSFPAGQLAKVETTLLAVRSDGSRTQT